MKEMIEIKNITKFHNLHVLRLFREFSTALKQTSNFRPELDTVTLNSLLTEIIDI